MYDQIDEHLRECRRHGVEPDWQELLFDLDPFHDGEHPRRDRAIRWGIPVGFVVAVALLLLDKPAGGGGMVVFGAALVLLAVHRFVSAELYQSKHRRK